MAKTRCHKCHIVMLIVLFPFPSLSHVHSKRQTHISIRTQTHTHTHNTPLYLQTARGRQSVWINSLSAYISIPAHPTANKTQFTVNELLRHSWGSLTVTLHSTPITNSWKKSTHTDTKKCDYKRHSAVLQHSPVFYQNKAGKIHPSRQFKAHTWMSIAKSRENMI